MLKKIIIMIFILINAANVMNAEDTRYNENLNQPQNVSGGGNVSVQTGALTIGQTDLTLPGRDGLHFEVSRLYSSVTANVYNMSVTSDGESKTTSHTPLDWKYGLGAGWTFSWPFIYKDLDDLNETKKLNLFWGGSVYELEEYFLADKDENNIKYYDVNDIRLTLDSSVRYKDDQTDPLQGALNNLNVVSKYCLELKTGIKYYFSGAGNLMVIRKPVDNGTGTVHYTEIWFYYKSHKELNLTDDYTDNRDDAKIEMVKDSLGRIIDFIYQPGGENWLEEIRYSVNIEGNEMSRSVNYTHENLSSLNIYRINPDNKTLNLLAERIPSGDYKFCLTGFTNQKGQYSKYDYRMMEAPFSFNDKIGTANNYFINLTSVSSIYTDDPAEKYKNKIVYEYNQFNSAYQVFQRKFTGGFMNIFKVTREYALNKTGETFNENTYGYYGSSYVKAVDEYWTERVAGGMKIKYVYGAKHIAEEENLLKYTETSANNNQFKERVDFVYDVHKTLTGKTLYRSSIEKYTESYIYDINNDLVYQKLANGLEINTVYDQQYHIPNQIIKKAVKNGSGGVMDIENRVEIRNTDGKPLYETIYVGIPGKTEKRAIRVKEYQYDAYGNPIEIKDALGHTVKMIYDAQYHIFPEKVEMQVTLDGQLTTVSGLKRFNSDGTVWIETDHDGYAVEHLYDALGTEIKTILPDDNDYTGITSIDDFTQSAWTTSRSDNRFIELQVDYQDESVITYGEEFNGKRLKTGKFADGLGHVLKEVLYENEESQTEYSVKSMIYDGQGNMIALTDPDADRSRMPIRKFVNSQWIDTYDKTWLVWYDDLKRKEKVIYPDKGIKVVQKKIYYDDLNFIVTTANTKGIETKEYYDFDGNLTKIMRPGAADENGVKKDLVYQFEYNQLKQKIAFTDALGERVAYSFDERGLLTRQDYGNGADLMTYNDNGNLLAKTDRNQNLIQFSYDEIGRNIRQEYFYPDDPETYYDYIELGYNGRGNLTKVKSSQLNEAMIYDARARLKTITRTYRDPALRADLANQLDWVTGTDEANQQFTFDFTYTPNNLVDTMTLPNGKEIRYHYDEDKLRLTGIDATVNTALTPVITGLDYNRSGQVTRMDYANGTSQYWEFDLRSRIKKINVKKDSGDDLLKLEYQIDSENNITAINDNHFIYDELDRIIKSDILRIGKIDYRVKVKAAFGTSQAALQSGSRTFDAEADLNNDGQINAFDHIKACQDWREKYDREAFTYDFNGNRRKLTQNGNVFSYTYGTRNQLLNIRKNNLLYIEYQYDANGNTLQRKVYNDNNTVTLYTFRYDIQNRLIEVKKDGQPYARYIYDNAGMRMYKEEQGKRTYYFRNGGTVNYEVEITQPGETAADVEENTYIISGELIAGRITRKNSGTDTLYYYHLDHLNSTKMVTDQTQTVVLEYEYRAFGTELDRQGSDKNRFSYIGREFDEEIGLYYVNARYYDATIGRFINVDPVQDGVNWYVYCGNNPLKLKDPTGLNQYEPDDYGGSLQGHYELFRGCEFGGGCFGFGGVSSLRSQFPAAVKTQRTTKEEPSKQNAVKWTEVVKGFFQRVFKGIVTPRVTAVKSEIAATKVSTPYGDAIQALTKEALYARGKVESGATLYRIGTLGKSAAGEAQFWSLENPLSPGYAGRYGIPPENIANADFIETATLKPGTTFITRPAPGFGTNPGGGIEVVVPSGGVNLQTFESYP